MTTTETSPARTVYEAYRQAWASAVPRDEDDVVLKAEVIRWPEWDALPAMDRECWAAAAEAVRALGGAAS